MPMNAERSWHALEAQTPIAERDSEKLSKPKAIEPTLASEAREAGLGTSFQPPKKPLIGTVQTLERRSLKVCREA